MANGRIVPSKINQALYIVIQLANVVLILGTFGREITHNNGQIEIV
jgi:hypothetical protein